MKILHVVPTYLPAWRYGGPIVSVHGLCKALVARGHEVDVFTTNVDGKATLDVPCGIPVDVDGVRVHYFPSEFPRLYWSRAMRSALRTRANAYDVIHSHAIYLWPGIAAAAAARRAKTPYLISPRGMLVPELIRQKSRFLKSVWLRAIEARAFAGAAAIHFTSELERKNAMRVGIPIPNAIVLGNGVEVSPLPEVARADDLVIHVGRISWKKRIDRAIAAIAAVPGARLLIVGNDDENLTPRLVAQADALGVGARVQFAGAVYGEEKDRLLASAALFILLSESENFGNAVLEALAMETPAVLSDDVGVAEEIVAAEAGVIGADPLGDLLRDRERRAVMGRNGRNLVETRFTWPRIAEQMEKAYGSAVQAAHAR